MTLEQQGFLLVEQSFDGGTMLLLQPLVASHGPRRPLAPALVPLDELDQWKDRRVLVTVSIPLEHLDARSAMGIFNPFFDARYEQLRNSAGSNALVATALAYKLPDIVALAQALDQPPAPSADAPDDLVHRVEELETRVAALEGR